jgi:hypothetical protein
MRIATPGNLSKLLPEAVHRMGRTPPDVRFWCKADIDGNGFAGEVPCVDGSELARAFFT